MNRPIALSDQAHQAIAALLGAQSTWDEPPGRRLRFHGIAPQFDSPHKLTLAAASAIGAYALATERWGQLATGQRQNIAIDWMQAASSLNPAHFQRSAEQTSEPQSLIRTTYAVFLFKKQKK